MTVEEAIQKLIFLNEALNFQRSDADECSCALQMGMDAIKEVQELHAIGTVSEFRELKEKATAKTNIKYCKCCGRLLSLSHEKCYRCGTPQLET